MSYSAGPLLNNEITRILGNSRLTDDRVVFEPRNSYDRNLVFRPLGKIQCPIASFLKLHIFAYTHIKSCFDTKEVILDYDTSSIIHACNRFLSEDIMRHIMHYYPNRRKIKLTSFYRWWDHALSYRLGTGKNPNFDDDVFMLVEFMNNNPNTDSQGIINALVCLQERYTKLGDTK